MANASALISNFGQNAPRGLLGNTMAGINQIVTQKRAAEAERQRMAKYQGLLSQFKETGDYNLFLDMQNVAPEKFEGFMKAWEPMDHTQKQQTAKKYGDILGQLDAGNTDLAAQDMEGIAESYESDGNYDEANKWRKMLQALDPMNPEKQNPEAVKTMLTAYLASGGEEGLAVLGGRQSISEDIRKGQQNIADLIDTGMGLEVGSPEFKNWAGTLGYKIGGQLGKDIVDLAQLTEKAQTDPSTMANLQLSYNKLFNTRIAPYQKINIGNGNVQKSIQNAKETNAANPNKKEVWTDEAGVPHEVTAAGVYDLTAINSFQRLIDDATVRESDIKNIGDTAGISQALEKYYNRIINGQPLTDQQRNAMAKMGDDLENIAGIYVDEQAYPSINALHNGQGFGEYGTEGFTGTFGNYIPPDQRKEGDGFFKKSSARGNTSPVQPSQNLTELQKVRRAIRARWPDDTTNNVLGKTIEEMSIEELKIAYPNTYPDLFGDSTTAPLNAANTSGGVQEVNW